MEHNILYPLVLGVLQGLTEFLPVSSSGHLILAEYFLGLKDVPLVFDVTLHLGTLLAVLIYFWKDWLDILRSVTRPRKAWLLWLLILGTVPGALFGFLFEDLASTVFRSPWVVVCTLSGVAMLLYAAERWARHTRGFEDLRIKDALLIGTAQALAIVPGTSRSGITMTTGMFLGLDRRTSARFSFLLSAPIIAGAGSYELLKLVIRQGASELNIQYLYGFLAAAISGYVAIAFLMKFLTRHTFYPFIYYRLALAAIVAALLVMGG